MRAMDRRALLGGLGTAAAAAFAAPAALGRARRGLFQRLHQPVGLQLGALGTIAPREIDATLANVAEIGFREIELPGLLGLQPAAWAAAATRAGLKITSLHLPLQGMGGAASLSMLSEPARSVFAEQLAVDPAQWRRGQAWALSIALIQLPYYYVNNPVLAGIARRTIQTILRANA